MSLREYLLVAVRHWIALLVTMIVGAAAGAGVYLTIPDSYEASAQVLFTGHATTNGQDQAYEGGYVGGQIHTYRRLGESSILLKQVTKSLKSHQTVREMRARTDLAVVPGTTIITVTATGRTRHSAARVADTIAGALVGIVQQIENGAKPNPKATTVITGIIIGSATADTGPGGSGLSLYLLIGAVTGMIVGYCVAAARHVDRGKPAAPKDG